MADLHASRADGGTLKTSLKRATVAGFAIVNGRLEYRECRRNVNAFWNGRNVLNLAMAWF